MPNNENLNAFQNDPNNKYLYQVLLASQFPMFGLLNNEPAQENARKVQRKLAGFQKPTYTSYELRINTVKGLTDYLDELTKNQAKQPTPMTSRPIKSSTKKNHGLRMVDDAKIFPNVETSNKGHFPNTLVIDMPEPNPAYIEQATQCAPIFMIKGAAGVYKIDLSVFYTANIRTGNKGEIELRHQEFNDKETWECKSVSQKTKIPVAKYANIQENVLNDHLKSVINYFGMTRKQKLTHKQTMKFGTNLDMEYSRVWKRHYDELARLPEVLAVFSKQSNMLSYIGRRVFGMNLAQIYMKTPHVKTPCHQENNSFASINLNIGPGACVWYGVAYEHWPKVERMCQKRGIDFMWGTYWPIAAELRAAGIPVHEFVQEAGDLVYVAAGCVHWVKSLGFCNNVAWNVGPMYERQLVIALRSNDYNIDVHYKSLVPLQTICWNIARSGMILEEKLGKTIAHVIKTSLKKVQNMSNLLVRQGRPINFQAATESDNLDICDECLSEAFCYVFEIGPKNHRCFTCVSQKQIETCRIYSRYEYVEELEAVLADFQRRDNGRFRLSLGAP